MNNPNDVRTHKIEPQTLAVRIDLQVLCEPGDHSAFVRNLEDELAQLISERLENTTGVTHMDTPEFQITLGT